MIIHGVLHVECDTVEEADNIVLMLLASPSAEIVSWSQDGTHIGVDVFATVDMTPPTQ